MKASDVIARAKTGMVLSSPFYASLLMNLEVVVDNSVPTAYTDGIILGYNEGYIETLSIVEAKSLLAHEILHVALEHIFRGKGKNQHVWNMACDYVVNAMIAGDQEYVLGKDWLHNPMYAQYTAEQVYQLLMKDSVKQSPVPCPWGIDNSDSGDGSGRDSGDGEQNNYHPSNPGEVRQYPESGKSKGKGRGKSPEDAKAAWSVKVSQAVEVAKSCGNVPRRLERAISEMLEPVIPWASALSRFMIENTRNDYSWSKPSSRYMHAGMYMPIMEMPSLGKIIIAVDTSGSVTEKNLSEYASEIRSILMIAPGTEITVIYADSAVAHVEDVSMHDLELHPHGGGGTDYAPAFEYVSKSGEDVTCLIYFTDGHCYSFPKDSPSHPSLWVVNGNSTFNPPFGEVIFVNSEQ